MKNSLKIRFLRLELLIFVFILLAGNVSPAKAQAIPESGADVLVRLKAGADVDAVAADNGAIVKDRESGGNLYGVSPKNGKIKALINRLLQDARVQTAEEEGEVRTPELYGADPAHLPIDWNPNPAQYFQQVAYDQINMPSNATMRTSLDLTANKGGVIVAVLDTGVASAHPALQGHLLPGRNILNPKLLPEDFADGVTNGAVGHGTMIAGLIAQLAPSAKILPVRVLNGDGVGKRLAVIKGIRYALSRGAKIINISFGSWNKSDALEDVMDEVESAGALIIAAAGNSGQEECQYPASFNYPIAVAAVETSNIKSDYSSFSKKVDLVAPGSLIRSAIGQNEYATCSGTSFATVFVSVEAALVWQARPDLSASDVRKVMRKSARSVDGYNPDYAGKLGKGLIDVETALRTKP